MREVRSALVGRDRELGELVAALGQALDGRLAVALIAGEPGIGKTRLTEALCEEARRRGAAVHVGRCWDGAGAPPAWPWVQALRELLADADPAALRTDLRDLAGDLAALVPELDRQLGGVPPAPQVDAEQRRFRLLDAVATTVAHAARRQPRVLVFEDLHWADATTLEALVFTARAATPAPALLVGTYRDVELRERPDGAAAVEALAREGLAIPLGGLGREDVGTLIEQDAAGLEPSGELADRVAEVTEGNPFFVHELARLLAAEPRLRDGDHAELPLPASVRETIARRLEPLAPEVRDTLAAAAVLGREFHLRTLAEARGAAPEGLLDHLAAAEAMRLVEGPPGRPGTFAFRHALVRQTLYVDLSPARRAELHARAAEALERVHGREPDDRLGELAHHLLQAAAIGDPVRAADLAARAARRSSDLFAYAEAASLLREALDVLEQHGGDDERRADLLLALGEAQNRAGGVEAARATLRAAAGAAGRLGDARRFGRAALASELWSMSGGDVDESYVALLEEAIARLEAAGEPPCDRPLLARLKGALAVALLFDDAQRERRYALVEDAIALAREHARAASDRREAADHLGHVLNKALIARWDPGAALREQALAREALELAREAGDAELEQQVRIWRVNAFLELDDLPAMRAEMAHVAQTAEELRQPRIAPYVPLERAMRALLEGRHGDVEAAMGEAAAAAAAVPGHNAHNVIASQFAALRYAQGRLAELEPLLRDAADRLPLLPAWRCGLACALAEGGRLDDAAGQVEQLVTAERALLPRDPFWRLGMALLAEAVALVGDAERAAVLRAELAPYAGWNAVALEAASWGPVDRYLGLLAATVGDEAGARAHFEAAKATARRQGNRPVLARLALDQARLLGDFGEAGAGRAMAAELELEGLVRRFDELGAAEPASPEPAVAKAVAVDDAPQTGTLAREGDVWTIAVGDRQVRLKHAKGLVYLRELLTRPGVEVHALELVAAAEGAPVTASEAGSAREAARDAELAVGRDDAGPLLDDTAKAAYRERLEQLRDEVEEADRFHDPERAARAREELEFLTAELASAVGLGGRDRRAASDAERARVSVTRAVRSVIRRVGEHDEALARLLDATVRTGTFCAYEPDPGRPIAWRL
jgi:hypothetical protein